MKQKARTGDVARNCNEAHHRQFLKSSVPAVISSLNLAIALLIFVISIAMIVPAVAAANDPGHDSLYILKIGDNVTGNFGITGFVNVSGATYLLNSKCTSGNYLTTDSNTGLVSCSTPAGGSGGGGWTNDSITSSTSYNVNVGSGKFWINSTSGNVSIGSTLPATSLSVDGIPNENINLGAVSGYNALWLNNASNISNYNFLSRVSDSNLYINRPLAKDIRFREANGDQVTFMSGGYVGIGTTGPTSALQVTGNASFATTSGNVGIGTDSPTTKLNVVGNITSSANIAAAAFYGAGTGLSGTASNLNVGGSAGSATSATTATNLAGGAIGAIPFQTGAGATSFDTSNLIWNSTNKSLGIGTATPQAWLHIKVTNAVATPMTALRFSYSATDYITDIQTQFWGANPAGNLLKFKVSDGTISGQMDVMTLTGQGLVGINTSSPTTALEVNGGIRINTSATKPTCSVTYRGTMWMDQSASGTDDFMWACMKNSTDNYNWIMVARGG
jgi:hypothetical protein